MIILGDTPQHKGKQLETLTRRLLEARNFKELNVNVMATGSELDVTGVYEMPSLSASVKHKAICECKATKATVDITQWLKFLGKLFHHEKTENDQYIGCFIALSGVNGYVQDNFNSLKNDKIQLLTGDTLTNVVVDFFKSINRSQVAAILAASTNRIPRNSELTLYKDDLFWTVELSDTEFTVVGGDGKLWTAENSTSIELLEKELAGSKFIDLNDENRLIQRKKDVAGVLLTALIGHEGQRVALNELPQILNVTQVELKEAAKSLHADGHIQYWEYKGTVQLPIKRRNNMPVLPLEIWRIIHEGKIHLLVLNNRFVEELINDEFLNDISALHANLPIPSERRPIWINMLRLCRDAVKLLVNPIPELVQHRTGPMNPTTASEAINQMDVTHLEHEMMKRLTYDYRKPVEGDFFKNRHHIEEMETFFSLKVKTDTGILFECAARERHMLAPLVPSLGGGYHPILLRIDHPEPWDHEAVAEFRRPKMQMDAPLPETDGEQVIDAKLGMPVKFADPK